MWIGFDGTKALLYLNQCRLNEHQLIIHHEQKDKFKHIITDMLNHQKLSNSNELYLQSKLYEFFSLLANTTHKSNIETSNLVHHPYVDKAIEYIQNNYQNKMSISELANYLSLNRSYLTTLFKQETGLSPQEFLSNYRMKQSEILLLNTSFTIYQIANSCGCANQLSFSKAFRQHHHMAPRDFRNKKQ